MNISKTKNKSSEINLFSGGRALNAIWANKELCSTQKLILIYMGSQFDFNQDYIGQWKYFPIQKIAQATSFSPKTIITILKKLVLNGYLYKKITPKSLQIKENLSNYYALTPKVFEAYQKMVNESNQDDEINKIETLSYSPGSLQLPIKNMNDGNPLPLSSSDQFPNCSLISPSMLPIKEKNPEIQKFENPLEPKIDLEKQAKILASSLKSVLKGEYAAIDNVKSLIIDICSELKIDLLEFSKFMPDITNPKLVGFIFRKAIKEAKEIDYFGIKKDLLIWISSKNEILLAYESRQKQIESDIEVIQIEEKPSLDLSKEDTENMFKAMRKQLKESLHK